MHPVEDVGISPRPVDVVKFGADAYAYRKQVDVKQLYNQVPQAVWVSWSSNCSSVPVAVGCGVRTSRRQRAWALSTPVEQPNRMRRKCCNGQRNLWSIRGSLSPSPTHLSHIPNINPFATLSRIKCEKYVFIKKCVRFVHWSRHYVSAYICMYMSIQQDLHIYICRWSFTGVWVTTIFPGLQVSSEYFEWYQKYCSLNGHDSSSHCKVVKSIFQSFVTVPSAAITIVIIVTPSVSHFLILGKVHVIFYLLAFFCCRLNGKIV